MHIGACYSSIPLMDWYEPRLLLGMAIRMAGPPRCDSVQASFELSDQALDLGLNRNPEKWMHNGRELFNEKEKSVRKRIWWACCLADK